MEALAQNRTQALAFLVAMEASVSAQLGSSTPERVSCRLPASSGSVQCSMTSAPPLLPDQRQPLEVELALLTAENTAASIISQVASASGFEAAKYVGFAIQAPSTPVEQGVVELEITLANVDIEHSRRTGRPPTLSFSRQTEQSPRKSQACSQTT